MIRITEDSHMLFECTTRSGRTAYVAIPQDDGTVTDADALELIELLSEVVDALKRGAANGVVAQMAAAPPTLGADSESRDE